MTKLISVERNKISVDASIFRNTDLTIFEAFVKYLREELGMSYHDMGLLLGRDERNIWTVYNRTKKKK